MRKKTKFYCTNTTILPQMFKLIAKIYLVQKPLEIVYMITPDSEPTPLPFRLMLLPKIITEKITINTLSRCNRVYCKLPPYIVL